MKHAHATPRLAATIFLLGLSLWIGQTASQAADCARASVGFVPLSDLGTGSYLGFQGGLYPGGTNATPGAHALAGLKIARGIRPIAADGTSDGPDGRIVMISVGMSNTNQEFSSFVPMVEQDPARKPEVVVVNTAQGGWSAERVAGDGAAYWAETDRRLRSSGLTPLQVQVAWLKQADARPDLPFPQDAQKLQGEIKTIVQALKQRYPNLALVYLSSRIYAGYATTSLNPEPFAYQSGFAVKWVIEEQIGGNPDLNYDPAKGAVKAPWLAWGPYLWADGMKPRSDGLVWECGDLRESDGTHPSDSGRAKVAGLLLKFFKTDPTATPWFLKLGSAPLDGIQFAQFAGGDGWNSSVTLTNPSDVAAVGTLHPMDDLGRPLLISFNGEAASTVTPFVIPPLGSATFTTSESGSLASGSLRVATGSPLSGLVRFAHPLLGIASVGESIPLSSFMTPVIRDANRGWNTGIAVANSRETEVELSLSLRGLDGLEVPGGSASVTLAGNGHTARFIDQLFPGALTADFEGSLVVRAAAVEDRVSAAAVQIGDGGLTALPVIALGPTTEESSLSFAQFADGQGWSSSIFLVNPRDSSVQGEIAFFDDAGMPLAVAVNGMMPSSRVSFELPPSGGGVFTTGGGRELVTGSVRVNAGGAVGGVLQLAMQGLGIAGVGGSAAGTELILPAARSAKTEISTGVALASVGSAVIVRLTLRGEDGVPLAGGEAGIQIPAGGHIAQFIEQLFPGAGTEDYRGTVTIRVEGGKVAATALEMGSRPGELTALPVASILAP